MASKKLREKSRSRRSSCGKVRYPDEQSAKNALRRIANSVELRDKTPIRWYACDECHGCHLTSQER